MPSITTTLINIYDFCGFRCQIVFIIVLLSGCATVEKQIIVDYKNCFNNTECIEQLLNSQYFLDAIPSEQLILLKKLPSDQYSEAHFGVGPHAYVSFSNVVESKSYSRNKRRLKSRYKSKKRSLIRYGENPKTWAIEFVGALDVQDTLKGKNLSKQLISVLDNGVDWEHPYLKEKLLYNTEDPIEDNDIGCSSENQFDVADYIYIKNLDMIDSYVLRRKLQINKQCSSEEIDEQVLADDDKNGYSDDYKGWNFNENNKNTSGVEKNSHGLEMIGIISANYVNNNNEVIPPIGLSNSSKHVVTKIKGRRKISAWKFLKAISYGLKNDVKLFNFSANFRLSCTYKNCSKDLEVSQIQFCNYLLEMLSKKDAVLFASAPGSSRVNYSKSLDELNSINSNPKHRLFPSACSNIGHTKASNNIVVVTSLKQPIKSNPDDLFTLQQGRSVIGQNSIQIAAPGERIYTLENSTINDELTKNSKGTSAATAMMTGGVALLMSSEKFKSCTAPQVAKIILNNANTCSCFEENWQGGRILNLHSAFNAPIDADCKQAQSLIDHETNAICISQGSKCLLDPKKYATCSD